MAGRPRADHQWVFLIAGMPYTHRSSGIRALYRLCHHLNSRGLPTAVVAARGERLPEWNLFLHDGAVGNSVVIYPEVVSGNPLSARRVVRWVLNSPGLIGGDDTYDPEELVFLYDLQKLAEVNRATPTPVGPERSLWMGLVDPAVIYPDPAVPRDLQCTFTHKGAELARRVQVPVGQTIPLESLTWDLASLGDALRRTRTLYSFDHYSNVLREAVISGCTVRVPDAEGTWHDPRACDCTPNIQWHPHIETAYVEQFHSSDFVAGFLRQVAARWPVPDPDLDWVRQLPYPGDPRRTRQSRRRRAPRARGWGRCRVAP